MMHFIELAQWAAPILAEVTEAAPKIFSGNFALAIAGLGGALGVGLVGAKAAEAVGRNPGAFGKILTIAILGMALAEAIAIYALFMALQG